MSASELAGDFRRACRWFVGVVVRRQTYYSLLYLSLAFPLGLAYFVFLVAGGITSAVLVVLLVGIPMLLTMQFVVIELTALERWLASSLLDAEIPTSSPPEDLRERAWRLVFDLGPWRGLVFLFSRFVIGIGTFVVVVTGLSVTFTLVTAPLHYQNEQIGIHVLNPIEVVPEITYQHDEWAVDVSSTITVAGGEVISNYADSLGDALVVSLVGVVVGIVVLHLFNGLAWLQARYAELLLRRTQPSVISELRSE